MIRNWHNHKARQLKATILRYMNRNDEALKWIDDSLQIDRFNMGCRYERYLLTRDENTLNELRDMMRGWSHGCIEYALDFASSGNYDEAIKHLEAYNGEDQIIAPQMKHALGNCYSHKNNYEKAISLLLEAAEEANNPAVTPYCWFDVAAMYVEQGKKAEAVELYAKIKQEYPNTPVAEQAEIKLNSMK